MMEPKELALKVAKLLDDKKAQDVTVIDIGLKASFADYFIIASGGSERQMSALVDNVEDMLEPLGVFPKSIEGKRTSGWTLMDYGDVIVHIFNEETREFYGIENLWADAQVVDISEIVK